MPNIKIFVDETVFAARRDALRSTLGPLRESVCTELAVKPEACQIAVIPVMGAEGQALANMELQYIARPERTPERIRAACTVFRALLEGAIGTLPEVRATPLDPSTYVALKG